MQEGQETEHDQHVAGAEDIRRRPTLGDGEDVAQPGQVGTHDDVRVLEAARPRLDPGRPERAGPSGHHPVVDADRRGIERTAEADHPQEGHVPVEPEGNPHKGVGGDVPKGGKRRGRIRNHLEHEYLKCDGCKQKAGTAQSELGQGTKPPAGKRDGEQAEQRDQPEQHLSSLSAVRLSLSTAAVA